MRKSFFSLRTFAVCRSAPWLVGMVFCLRFVWNGVLVFHSYLITWLGLLRFFWDLAGVFWLCVCRVLKPQTNRQTYFSCFISLSLHLSSFEWQFAGSVGCCFGLLYCFMKLPLFSTGNKMASIVFGLELLFFDFSRCNGRFPTFPLIFDGEHDGINGFRFWHGFITFGTVFSTFPLRIDFRRICITDSVCTQA